MTPVRDVSVEDQKPVIENWAAPSSIRSVRDSIGVP